MQTIRRATASAAITAAMLLVLLIAAAQASAAQRAITGRTTAGGYTIVAVAANGKTTYTRVRGSRHTFRLVPPASRVTLHLRRSDGSYGGPIVTGKKSGKLVMGVKAGTKLGKIKVRSGYATLTIALRKRFQDRTRLAKHSGGKPLGAGKFGYVETFATGSGGPGRDQDHDGIVGAFDVDDDGDYFLDNVDPNPDLEGRGAARGGAGTLTSSFYLFSNLKLPLESTVNSNAGGTTSAQIDAAMAASQTLAIDVLAGDSSELDCGALSYCTTGGTGTAVEGGAAFPGTFDADSDGFGTIADGPTGDFQLLTGASSSDIGTGDAMFQLVTTGSTTSSYPGMLSYAFTGTPAAVSYTDSAAVPNAASFTYPAAPGDAGTAGSPLNIAADMSGDVWLTLEFWRPQRAAVPAWGETGDWTDIGLLNYSIDIPNEAGVGGPTSNSGPGMCSAANYAETDAQLSASGDSLLDSAFDLPADAANTLTFSVNLTDCLAASGAFDVGETAAIDLQARTDDGDNAAQKIYVTRSA